MKIDPPTPPTVSPREGQHQTAPTQRIAQDPVQKQPQHGSGKDQQAPHKDPNEGDQDITYFSVAVIDLMLEQQPDIGTAQEIAEIRTLLAKARTAGIEEIPIALNQSLRQAIEAALSPNPAAP